MTAPSRRAFTLVELMLAIAVAAAVIAAAYSALQVVARSQARVRDTWERSQSYLAMWRTAMAEADSRPSGPVAIRSSVCNSGGAATGTIVLSPTIGGYSEGASVQIRFRADTLAAVDCSRPGGVGLRWYPFKALWNNIAYNDADGNGYWEPGESFTTTPSSSAQPQEWFFVYPTRRQFRSGRFGTQRPDGTQNHTSVDICGNPGEPYLDLNQTGLYEPSEISIDLDHDGDNDAVEPYTDANLNGQFDPPEPYVDLNANHTWDPGETYTDLNGNGVWDANDPWSDVDMDYHRDLGVGFIDGNGNGTMDAGDTFIDLDGDGFREPRSMTGRIGGLLGGGNGVRDPDEPYRDIAPTNNAYDLGEPFLDFGGYLWLPFGIPALRDSGEPALAATARPGNTGSLDRVVIESTSKNRSLNKPWGGGNPIGAVDDKLWLVFQPCTQALRADVWNRSLPVRMAPLLRDIRPEGSRSLGLFQVSIVPANRGGDNSYNDTWPLTFGATGAR